jgi:3-deoxy-manno-octulosonate cytidylyltransferase (CMP-KDO synthetase)
MVEHVHRQATAARLVDAILVATDDQRVAEAVDAFGGTAVLTDPNHATGTDRLAEVAAHLEGDLVVNVQGDEPLITGQAIDLAIQPCLRRDREMIATLRRRIDDMSDLETPSVVKVVVDRDGYALYFSRSRVPFTRPGQPAPVQWRHLGLYVYPRTLLLTLAGLAPTPLEQAEGLEQLRALEHGIRILTVETTVDTIGVDTPEDLERARSRLEGLKA